MTEPDPSKDRRGPLDVVRRVVPILGTIALLGYLAYSTDLPAVAAAFSRASIWQAIAVLLVATLATWLADSACLTWLIGRNLADRGDPRGTSLRQILPLKAGSYVLNIVNYNAATLGMAYVVARRRRVSFLEATAALSVLSYVDLLALAALVTVGLQVSPEVISVLPGLVDRLVWLVTGVFSFGVFVLLLIQSPLRWRPLEVIRGWAIVRPLAAMSPVDMALGVLMRAGFVMLYVAANFWMMRCFGMSPEWGPMLTIVPVLTVVGVVPLSISGLGTTQLLMRTLYAPFVADGRDPTPVIDAWSTSMIFGFILIRLLVALPYLPSLLVEIQHASGSDDPSEK